MIIRTEYTDTFGGEANYTWVRRTHQNMKDGASRLAIIRAAKKAQGLNGIRGRVMDNGDSLEFRPYGMNTVLFITIE